MNILVLTKMKPMFLKPDVKNVYDYLRYDYFFEGFVEGFTRQGHKVFLIWDESFFLKPNIKLASLFLWRILNFLFRKTGLKKIDRYLFSKAIAKYCKKNNIDFIFTEINNFISPHIIKRYNFDVIVTQWYGTFPEMNDKDVLKMLSEYDIIWGPCEFDNSKVFFEGMEKLKYVGCAVNKKQFYYDYDKNYSCDVVFIGGVGKGHANRINILEALAKKYKNFAFYGYGIENVSQDSILRKKYKGWADVTTIRKLYSSSKVILNLTLDGYDRVKRGFNSRLFEIAACNGGVQVVKYDKKILDFFVPNKELLTFESIDELYKKIDSVLKDEKLRKEIATNAYKKALRYTYFEKTKLVCNVIKERLK